MIFGLWGEDKTCKSSLALTFPTPIAYMEFDVGGGDRAIRNDTRHGFRDMLKDGRILTKYQNGKQELNLQYVMPLQAGAIDPVKNIIRPSKIVTGVKELWYRWLAHYITLLKAPDDVVRTIDIDTATLLWEVCHTTVLQEKQELQLDTQGNLIKPGDSLRTQLTQIEYREPNLRMRGVVYQAKAHGKNLVLTHHARDEYGNVLVQGTLQKGPTGKRERAGWGGLGDSADIIVHCYLKDEPVLVDDKPTGKKVKVPYCQIELAEILELSGMELREPTYDMINQMLGMLRGEG